MSLTHITRTSVLHIDSTATVFTNRTSRKGTELTRIDLNTVSVILSEKFRNGFQTL